MEKISTDALQYALLHVSRRIVESEPYLTEVDSIIGDGDHGEGMKIGFSALGKLLQQNKYDSPFELIFASGIELIKTMGGASGVLFGTLFIGGLDSIKGLDSLSAEDLAAFFEKSITAIMKRGRTKPGDKTMIDALVPALAAMKASVEQSPSIKALMKAASDGAKQGMENTKAMVPRAGRSKNFREKAIGYPDPGAISVSIIFNSFYEAADCQKSC